MITVAIPTIPPRKAMLRKAIASVMMQTYAADAIAIAVDVNQMGSDITRNNALAMVQTPYVAFLDDDDLFLPRHLETLLAAAIENNADVVYSLPRVMLPDGRKVERQHDWGGGETFDPAYLRRKAHIQTTSLVRTELAKHVGGFRFVQDETGALNDDHGFYLRLLDAGAKFYHVHEETFIWNHHGYGRPGTPGNTSGQPDRW